MSQGRRKKLEPTPAPEPKRRPRKAAKPDTPAAKRKAMIEACEADAKAPRPEHYSERGDGQIVPGAVDNPCEPPSQATRADLALVRQAITSRWPVPPALRRRAMAEAAAIIRHPMASNRSKIAAMKLLMAADAINLEQEKRDDPSIKERHELTITAPAIEQAKDELMRWREEMRQATQSSLPSAPPTRPTSPTPTES